MLRNLVATAGLLGFFNFGLTEDDFTALFYVVLVIAWLAGIFVGTLEATSGDSGTTVPCRVAGFAIGVFCPIFIPLLSRGQEPILPVVLMTPYFIATHWLSGRPLNRATLLAFAVGAVGIVLGVYRPDPANIGALLLAYLCFAWAASRAVRLIFPRPEETPVLPEEDLGLSRI